MESDAESQPMRMFSITAGPLWVVRPPFDATQLPLVPGQPTFFFFFMLKNQ